LGSIHFAGLDDSAVGIHADSDPNVTGGQLTQHSAASPPGSRLSSRNPGLEAIPELTRSSSAMSTGSQASQGFQTYGIAGNRSSGTFEPDRRTSASAMALPMLSSGRTDARPTVTIAATVLQRQPLSTRVDSERAPYPCPSTEERTLATPPGKFLSISDVTAHLRRTESNNGSLAPHCTDDFPAHVPSSRSGSLVHGQQPMGLSSVTSPGPFASSPPAVFLGPSPSGARPLSAAFSGRSPSLPSSSSPQRPLSWTHEPRPPLVRAASDPVESPLRSVHARDRPVHTSSSLESEVPANLADEEAMVALAIRLSLQEKETSSRLRIQHMDQSAALNRHVTAMKENQMGSPMDSLNLQGSPMTPSPRPASQSFLPHLPSL
jgi:hypothetical protein